MAAAEYQRDAFFTFFEYQSGGERTRVEGGDRL